VDVRLIPYQSLTLVSPRQPAEVASFLTSLVYPPLERSGGPGFGKLFFLGEVEGGTFKLRIRRSGVMNPSPVLTGRTEPTPGGTLVRLRMRPGIATLVSMMVWFAFVVPFAIVSIPQFIRDNDPTCLVAAAMALFWWTLWLFGFWWYAGEAVQILRRELQATRDPAPAK
jgi:hypothetical protein